MHVSIYVTIIKLWISMNILKNNLKRKGSAENISAKNCRWN